MGPGGITPKRSNPLENPPQTLRSAGIGEKQMLEDLSACPLPWRGVLPVEIRPVARQILHFKADVFKFGRQVAPTEPG